MTISRSFQWIGATLVLLVLVGLNYDFDSKAGMRMNASLDDPLSQSLRGYWKLDEGTGTSTTADASGNANTLSMTGPPTWTTGTIGPFAMDFSGSGQYLSIASPSSVLDFAAGTNFTLTGWFNRDLFGADHTILSSKSAQTTSDGYIIWIDNNAGNDYLNFRADENGSADAYSLISTTNLSATGWHHFAVSWNESAPDAILYIDGAVDGAASGTAFASMGDLSNANPFSIGAETDGGNPFDGKLDDIRVYGYALSAGEVTKLYQTTAPTQPVDTGLVGHWTFDGPDIQGTTAIDRSSFGNNGTITGALPAKGKLGQALSFNGTSDLINMGDQSSLDFGAGSFSFSVWLYYSTSSQGSPIWKGGEQETNAGFCLGNISPEWAVKISDGVSATEWLLFSKGVNDTNEWMLLSAVVNRSDNTLKTYTNAIFSNSVDISGIGSVSSTYEFQLGRISNYGTFYKGKIDDVRIYNRALSVSEVISLYNTGK